jgi:hypothetical protein
VATAIPAGTTAYPAAAAGTYQFSERYGYVQVENSATNVIYASTDPTVTSPSASTNNTVAIPAGGSATLANLSPMWFQSSRVIPTGTLTYPTGGGTPQTNTTKDGQPGIVQPQQSSLAGQLANPGTTVSLGGTTVTAIIAAAG